MNNIQLKNASSETFWSILKNDSFKISIPRMQRNYVQGRREVEVKQKRDNLLNDIFNSLTNKEILDLNFVYGSLYNNLFIPIDGQQRLTTLFLLYWYFAMLSENYTEEIKSILGKFTYETRDVTRQFCKKLVNDINLDLTNIEKNDLEKAIKDYYWFFNDFDNDSSISSMLVMLQAIHNKVMEIGFDTCKCYFNLLTSEDCPIRFLFLNIEDVGLTDEIYIKMNARGKPLTGFENFKAQLTNYLSKKEKDLSERILTQINGVWSQFFWSIQYQNDRVHVFDDQIMGFFKFMMFNEYVCNNKDSNLNNRDKIRYELKRLQNEGNFEFTSRLFKDEFRNVGMLKNSGSVVDERVFSKILKLLNALSYKWINDRDLCFYDKTQFQKEYFDEKDFFLRVVSDRLPYEDKVLLYAEYIFISKYSNEDGSFTKTLELTNWIRFIYNLSKSQLYNQQDDYYRSIRSINSMIENDYALDIITYSAYMSGNLYRQGRGFGFYDLQAKEESIKSFLILKDDNWRSLIIEAENSYLDNQIIAIINFAGIEEEYDSKLIEYEKDNLECKTIDHNYDTIPNFADFINPFSDYLAKIEVFFKKNGLSTKFEEQSIFRRALLTFGGDNSYLLIKEGHNYSFLSNKDRDYSFRRLLRDSNGGKRSYFKNLLDSIDQSKDETIIKQQLADLIDNFCSHYQTSWKYYFISMPNILSCADDPSGERDPMDEYVFKKISNQVGRFINMKSKDEILLCEGQSTRSMNREYYTYVLYLKAKERGLNVSYIKDFTETAEKYLKYNDANGDLKRIVYVKDIIDNKFKYFYKIRDRVSTLSDDIEYVLSFIERGL